MRQNSRIEIDGETKTLMEWCAVYKIYPELVRARVQKGWTMERALTEPLKHREAFLPRVVTIGDTTLRVRQWLARTGVPARVARMRYTKLGWPIDRAICEPMQVHEIRRDYTTVPEVAPRIPRGNPFADRPVTIDGDTRSVREWCSINEISLSTAYARYHSQWPILKAITTPVRPYVPLSDPEP
jgi:hypothetical protein